MQISKWYLTGCMSLLCEPTFHRHMPVTYSMSLLFHRHVSFIYVFVLNLIETDMISGPLA